MKRSEIAMIILVASLSMLLTFSLAQSLLGSKIKRTASVEQAQAISETIVSPAKRTFNSSAINPTVEVCVESNQADEDSDESSSGDQCEASAVTNDTTTATDEPAESDQTNN